MDPSQPIALEGVITMRVCYVLQHLHVINEYCGDKKMIGIYSSHKAAEAAVRRLGDQPGFRDCPEIRDPARDIEDGFYIIECELDNDYWQTGFAIVPRDATDLQKKLASCAFAELPELGE